MHKFNNLFFHGQITASQMSLRVRHNSGWIHTEINCWTYAITLLFYTCYVILTTCKFIASCILDKQDHFGMALLQINAFPFMTLGHIATPQDLVKQLRIELHKHRWPVLLQSWQLADKLSWGHHAINKVIMQLTDLSQEFFQWQRIHVMRFCRVMAIDNIPVCSLVSLCMAIMLAVHVPLCFLKKPFRYMYISIYLRASSSECFTP